MLTTESTTRHTANRPGGTFDAASRLCEAWEWLETQRRNAPEGADVWDIRWQSGKSHTYLTDLLHTLQAGEYRLSPMQLHGQGDDRKAVWGAQDALVLKWVALGIAEQLPLHPSCEHVKGHGGGQQSIAKLHTLLTTPEAAETSGITALKKTADYAWVCRTDIRGYYRNINKATLLNQVRQHVQVPVLTALIHQYVHYTVEDSGTFHTPEKGISRGCPLSSLMGALHLYDMDEHFSRQKDIHYARYMDDIIILAKTRWSLRKHTKRLMQWFSDYGFEAHPDKTQIGRTAKGFDWMGAWLTHEGVTDIAPRAKANHREKVRRLYERLARVPNWLRHRRQQQVHARVSAYRNRWNIWAGVMLSMFVINTASAQYYGWTYGVPSSIPSDGRAGDILSHGSVYYQGSGATYNDIADPVVGFTNDSKTSLAVAGGVTTARYWPVGCPSIGFHPTSFTTNGVIFNGSKTGVLIWDRIGAGTMAARQSTGQVFNKQSPGQKDMSLTVEGDWILTTDVTDPNFKCSDFARKDNQPNMAIGAGIVSANGVDYVDPTKKNTPWYGSGGGAPTNPPVIKASCALNAATGLTTQTLTTDITPNQINKQTNSHVIAKFPSSIGLTVSCTGDMTGVQPIVELAWTKSASLGGSGGLRIGVANDVDDTSNGILLSTKDSAVGATGDCGTVPEGYDMCGAYPINPATGLTLYPVLFRNTFNNAGNAKSGVHTVTGTLKVVVP